MDVVNQLSMGEIALRLGSAAAIGSALGINRELHHKPAGLRTHAMVAIGSALLALIGLHLERPGDAGEAGVQALSRVIQGVVTGIGFLGGGAILKDATNVRGLTTAASIWVVAALGLACGAGYWRVGAVAMVMTLIVLVFGGPVEHYFDSFFERVEDDTPPRSSETTTTNVTENS